MSRLSPRNCFVKISFISFCIIPFRFVSVNFVSFRWISFRLVSFRFVSVYFVSRFVSQFTGTPVIDTAAYQNTKNTIFRNSSLSLLIFHLYKYKFSNKYHEVNSSPIFFSTEAEQRNFQLSVYFVRVKSISALRYFPIYFISNHLFS